MYAKKLLLIIGISTLLMSCQNLVDVDETKKHTAQHISSKHAHLYYQGRWNHSQENHSWVSWHGSSVQLRFKGASISVELDGGANAEYFRLVINGRVQGRPLKVEAGRKVYLLAEGLAADQTHSINLVKETSKSNKTRLYGFTIEDGHSLPAPPSAKLRIAFFGDSNMAGYSMYSEKDSGEHGAYFGYPMTVARMLGAEMTMQAVGGATIGDNGDNSVDAFIYSEDFLNQDPSYRDGFEPQIIVVNAGANDVSQIKNAPLQATIKQRFKNVVKQLRQVYGDAPHIILFNAYGWHEQEPANYTQDFVDEIGGNISALHYPWMWEQWHGSMVEYAGQARLLAEHILRIDPRFELQQQPQVFDGFGRDFNLANGGFEYKAQGGFNAFAWRYQEDGVERVHAVNDAAQGEYFIRLNEGESVHQGTDATGDFRAGGSLNQRYRLRIMIRSPNGGKAQVSADYEGQALYQRDQTHSRVFSPGKTWQEYSAVFEAPDGTWKTYWVLKALRGEVEFDDIRVEGL